MSTIEDVLSTPPAADMPKVSSAPASVSSISDVLNSAPVPEQLPTKPSNTGLTTQPIPGWSDAYKALSDRWTLGSGSVSKGLEGWNLAVSDDHSFEEARHKVETHALLQAEQDKEDYANTYGYWSMMGANIGGGYLVESLPSLMVASGGAVGGAAIGSLTGKPEIGAKAGLALTFGVLSGGQAVYDLTERGVDRNTAKLAGLATGIAGGALALVGTANAGASSLAIAGGVLESTALKEATYQTALHIAKSSGVQIGVQGINSLVDSVVKYIATRASKTSRPYTMQEATDDIKNAVTQALVVGPQVAGVTGAFGIAAGARARRVQAAIDEQTALLNQSELKTESPNVVSQPLQQTGTADSLFQIRTAAAQIKSKKMLRGYAEVEAAPTEEAAVKGLIEAQEVLKSATDEHEKIMARFGVEHAQATLKEAQLATRLEAIEETLTNPPETGAEGTSLNSKLQEQKTHIEQKIEKIHLQAGETALKKRMVQRERVINQLRAEIRQDKQEARETGTVADTANNRARLEQLREQHSLDELLLQLFAEKIVKPEDVAFLRPQVPAKRLNGIVRVATNQVSKAAKAGENEQRKTTESMRKLLGAAINATRLPTRDKLALKNRVSDIQTFEKLASALPEIEQSIQSLFEKRRREAAHADLQNLLDTINPKNGQASKTPGTEEALTTIKDFARNPDAIERFALDLEEKEVITSLDQMKSELSALFPSETKSLSADQIEKIINTVVELRERGKTEALRRFQEIQTRQRKNEETFWTHATTSPKGKQISKEAVSTALFKTMSADPFKVVSRTWEGLMQLITQRGTISNLRDVFDLKAMNSKAWELNGTWRSRFKEIVSEMRVTDRQYAKAFNTGEKLSSDLTYGKRRFLDGADGPESYIETRRLEDPETGKNYNLWQLVQIRNHLLDADPDAISRLAVGNGFSYLGEVPKGMSTREVIEAHLQQEAPDLLKIGDAMRQFYKEFHTVVDGTVYRRWGRHIPVNETYGGPLISGNSLSALTRESFRRMTLRPGSMLERQGGSKRVQIANAFDVLDQHIQQFSRESAFLQFEQDAQALFGEQPVRDFITRNYGKITMDVIDKYVKDAINAPREIEGWVSKVAAFFRRKAFTMYLGGRPDQYIKQLTGLVHAFQLETPQDVIDGWSYFYANPKKSIELMNKSPLLKNRLALLDPDFKMPKPGDMESIANLTMKGVEAGDVAAVYLSSFPSLLKTLRETGSEEKAIHAFERAFESTQGSSAIDEMPHIYRSGTMVRMLTIFTGQANRQVEMISTAWDQFVNSPTKKNFADFANVTLVSYAGASLYPLAGWLLMAPFVDQEASEKKLKEILAVAPLGPFASLPVWGLALTPMMVETYNVVFNEHLGVFQPKALEADILGSFVKGVKALFQLGDGDAVHTWNAIMASANILGHVTGLPVPNVLRMVSPFMGVQKK